LEKEARVIWQKEHKKSKPTNKETNLGIFYMRIKTLYKESGEEREAKKDRGQRDNCQRRKEKKRRRNFREIDTVTEPGFFEKSWGARR
jgi:hypothetical protein